MHLRKICLTAVCIAIMLSIAAAICFLVSISPPKDEVVSIPYPPEFFCASAENRIDYQIDGKCAAYAAAYLLRHFGEEADGEALFPELKRPLGFVSANSIADVFAQHGYQTEAFHGNVGTLKQRLVVFFSRMGYVKKAAYEEADRTGACVYELKATERTEGTLGFWWCGRFAMHRWDMPIVPVGIDLSKEPLNKSSAAVSGSFSPTLRYRKREIHTVFRRFRYLDWPKNLSLTALADLIRVSPNISTSRFVTPFGYFRWRRRSEAFAERPPEKSKRQITYPYTIRQAATRTRQGKWMPFCS